MPASARRLNILARQHAALLRERREVRLQPGPCVDRHGSARRTLRGRVGGGVLWLLPRARRLHPGGLRGGGGAPVGRDGADLRRRGESVILPVEHDGGGLYFGDCKALMGDGEIVGPPEVGAVVTASAAPLPRPASLSWPRIETSDTLTTLVSGKPLEWSARQAFRELLNWVTEDYALPRPKAALLLAMVAHAGICQISNTDYTAYCTTPVDVLAPYSG